MTNTRQSAFEPLVGTVGNRGRVYIVDDQIDVRESLQILLEALRFDVRVVLNPLEFLTNAPSQPWGAILVDVRMPEINGIEFLEAIDGQKSRFAVIIMTGHGDIEMAVEALQKGAKDFLEKPLREETLTRVLDRELAKLASKIGEHEKWTAACISLQGLTYREREVLERLTVGKSNKVIAFDLGISVRTVEMHRSRMMDRLSCKSLADAISLFHLATSR